MPVIHTQSATPLEAVTLEPGRAGTTHVWLRKNVIKTTQQFEGEAQDVWEADEVYFHSENPVSLEAVQLSFEQLCAEHAYPLRGPEVSVDTRLGDIETALAELADILGDL